LTWAFSTREVQRRLGARLAVLDLSNVSKKHLPVFHTLGLKPRLRSLLADTPLRRIAHPLHRDLTRVELVAARLADDWLGRREVPSNEDLSRVTAIVKTFERPTELGRLLDSFRRLFPSLSVIVADDSRVPGVHAGTRTLALPFDVGVSAGRQAALDLVGTEFTWVLDDDFILYRGTRLRDALATLNRHAAIDLIGGPVIDLPFGIKQASVGSTTYPTHKQPVLPLGSFVGGLPVRDKVPNFFLARTERLRLVGWDTSLKRLDHGDFFTRARGVLVTVYDDRFRCLHAQTPFNRDYMRRRLDVESDRVVLRARYFT
jgi:hypothetical protein